MSTNNQNPDRIKRIAQRFIDRQAMAVVLRGVPGRVNWGFYTREDPRMHLQTVDRKHRNMYKVWLEGDRGRRVFEPEGDVPKKILDALQNEVRKRRGVLEGHWVELMIQKGWLKLEYSPEGVATITAYPGHNSFTRTVDVAADLPGGWPTDPAEVAFVPEMASLGVWVSRHESRRVDFDLTDILWVGRR